MSSGAGRPGRAALSKELGSFLIEFSIALHRYAMYPHGHPSLETAALSVADRLETLLHDRPKLSLGVARRQLVIDGVATDPAHPVLQELAVRLHRQHIGAVTFSRDVGVGEVIDVLQTLASDPDRTREALGLAPPERLRAWANVRLYPLTYDQLELVADDDAEAAMAGTSGGSRAAQLWVGLAHAALTSEGGTEESASTEPTVVAQAINERGRDTAYEQVIVGYLLQIAEELKTEGSTGAAALRRRMSRLVAGLRPDTLHRLVEMGGDYAQRRKFVLDGNQGLAVDAVLAITRAAAEASNQTISHSLVRLLSKLAAHAESGPAEIRENAEHALRDQVQRLVTGWSLPDPNPGGYTRVLQSMAMSQTISSVAPESARAAEPMRIVHMALEVGIIGGSVRAALDRLIEEGQLGELLASLAGVTTDPAATAELWTYVTTPEQIARILGRPTVDFEAVDRVVARAGIAAAGALLDALADSESRATRRGIFDRLVTMGPTIAPSVAERLDDPRWYVQRNMLALLAELDTRPDGFSALPYSRHDDHRVRREAYRILVRTTGERDRAICSALTDTDSRIVRLGLLAARDNCPAPAVPLIANRVGEPSFPPELRVLGIQVLADTGNPLALATLLRLATNGRTLTGRPRLAAKSPGTLAALAGLASRWRHDRRAAEVLAQAERSADPDVQAALRGLDE